MGVNVNNVTQSIDHSTGECYIELHRRIDVPAERWDELTRVLTSRDWASAREMLKALAPANAASAIEAMLAPEALKG